MGLPKRFYRISGKQAYEAAQKYDVAIYVDGDRASLTEARWQLYGPRPPRDVYSTRIGAPKGIRRGEQSAPRRAGHAARFGEVVRFVIAAARRRARSRVRHVDLFVARRGSGGRGRPTLRMK
jgi:hypothetical protein